jgi:diacylglycerol kinase family enzyme
LLGLLTTFLSYRNQAVSLTIDGRTETRKLCTVVVGNGRYGGGSMLLAPDADLTDGLFDLVTIGDVSKPDLLWSLPRIYRGTHLSHPKVNAVRAAEVTVDSAIGVAVQADGELLGFTPARFSILPSALNILV